MEGSASLPAQNKITKNTHKSGEDLGITIIVYFRFCNQKIRYKLE